MDEIKLIKTIVKDFKRDSVTDDVVFLNKSHYVQNSNLFDTDTISVYQVRKNNFESDKLIERHIFVSSIAKWGKLKQKDL